MDHMDRQQKDLVLNSNEFAFVLDKTKGNISVWTGPVKTSLSATDSPVLFDERSKRFVEKRLEEAIQSFIIAPENWYITLKNPDKNNGHPVDGKSSETPKLDIGRKVNINGPASFSLYPGQMAKVIRGHHLRSNQYLLVRVYDEESAASNWDRAVIKKVETPPLPPTDGQSSVSESVTNLAPEITTSAQQAVVETPTVVETKSLDEITRTDLTVGKVMVIKGTEVSFYIPPTGIEVLSVGTKSSNGITNYVREAVTLERLEYCILKDENGTKRYVRGPAVVFPEPTESFILDKESPKFRAIELSEISGIYIKVIADYKDENDKTYKAGEELFITGKEQMIYFPRPEHAFIKYGDNIVHHAIAIPKGNGRYVLDRMTGNIKTIKGPLMYLADPRKEVLVQRKLTAKQAKLWYPGNDKVMTYNVALADDMIAAMSINNVDTLMSYSLNEDTTYQTRGFAPMVKSSTSTNMGEAVLDNFDRKTTFTKPRTVTIDDNDKFDGVVQIGVWTGYAINVISKDGTRKVVAGPCTYNMEYDETLEVLEFSTGKPKTTDNLQQSVYLRVMNNKISDMIRVETKDFVSLDLMVSYNVDFTGEKDKWFSVENYVKFLCDHMRSHLKRVAKSHTIEEFYDYATTIIRDTVLGPMIDPNTGEKDRPFIKPRRERLFEENGMKVKDVEVLSIDIRDANIRSMLTQAQESDIHNRINLVHASRNNETEAKMAEYNKLQKERALELNMLDLLNKEKIESKHHKMILQASLDKMALEEAALESEVAQQDYHDQISKAGLLRKAARDEQEIEKATAMAEIIRYRMETETKGIKETLDGISPQLAATLKYVADIDGIGHIAQQLSPIALVNGTSIADTANKLLQGTALENVVRKLITDARHVDSTHDGIEE